MDFGAENPSIKLCWAPPPLSPPVKRFALYSCTPRKLRTVQPRYNEPLYNEVLDITNDFRYPPIIIVKYMKKNHDITKPRYSKNILEVPWPFVILRFHCTCFFLITFLQVSKTIFSSTTMVLLIPLGVPTIMEAWCTTETNFFLKMVSPRLWF